ncbi:MAG: hypothetical protein E6772_07585 [Dysgonomonas sp.]|nr:hypothetical protein [Dysgonomonas sp.]
MQLKHAFNIALILFFSLTIISCNDDNDLLPGVPPVVMDEEGGETVIDLNYSDFVITGVIRKGTSSNSPFYGNIYAADGSLLREAERLHLDGLGHLEWDHTGWNYSQKQGFSIIRDTPSRLKIVLKENNLTEDLSFAIIVEVENEKKEILVQQKKSQGYVFDDIEFSIQKGDGDSLYIKEGSSYKFTLTQPQEVQFSPFGGIQITKNSYFESNDYNAFVWTEGNPPTIEIPSYVYSEAISFNGDKQTYDTEWLRRPHGFLSVMEKFEAPAGESEIQTQIEFYKRTVSYTLTLTNNDTNKKKTVKGKWIETAPSGSYRIIRVK